MYDGSSEGICITHYTRKGGGGLCDMDTHICIYKYYGPLFRHRSFVQFLRPRLGSRGPNTSQLLYLSIWPQSHRGRDWPPNQHVGELQLHDHGAAAHAEPGLEKCAGCIGLKEPYLIARYGEKYPGGILLRRI